MCISSGGGAARALQVQQQQQADEATADAQKKAASLQSGMANINDAFGGFDDNYFNNIATQYENYAQPQLQDQYDQAKKNIVYSLARKGNLNSSVAGDQYALLDKQNATDLTGIESAANSLANNARQTVQSNKQDVIGQLDSTYDADAANSAALSAAKSLAAPVSFSPLGTMFSNIAATAAQAKLASDPYSLYGGSVGASLTPGSTGSLVSSNV
jgi:hypothetical protein